MANESFVPRFDAPEDTGDNADLTQRSAKGASCDDDCTCGVG